MYWFNQDISKAIKVLKSGGVILYPTDTIWGLGCDACNPQAVDRIFRIKRREDKKSMLVLVDTIFLVERYVKEVPDIAYQLVEVAERPLTIIYPGARYIAHNLIAEDDSLAIRITNESFTNRLIDQYRKPIVSTSANISGEASPANFSEISNDIIKDVDYVVKYRQDEKIRCQASEIIKLGLHGEIEIIRK